MSTRRKLLQLTWTLLVPAALAQKKGKGGKGGKKKQGGASFAAAEVTVILDYVRANPDMVPPAARQLPPGLAKNLRRGKPLPPGWQKKMGAFPPPLEGRLPPLPGGYRRVIVDRWALVIAEATNTVLDVIDLIKNS
ncbi:MAG: hypothetical protein R2729_20700 [Bryobacteraceae bacterium]